MNGPVKMARSCVRPTTVRLFSASTCRLRLAETCRVATWASAWRLTPITTAFFIWEHAAGMGCGAAPTTGRPGPRSAAFRTRAPIFQILPVHTPETRSAWCGSHSTLIRSAQAELRRQFMSASLTLGTVFIEARTVARPGAAVPGQPYRLSASSRQAGVERHALYQLQQRSRALRWQQQRCLEVRHFERNLTEHHAPSTHVHR